MDISCCIYLSRDVCVCHAGDADDTCRTSGSLADDCEALRLQKCSARNSCNSAASGSSPDSESDSNTANGDRRRPMSKHPITAQMVGRRWDKCGLTGGGSRGVQPRYSATLLRSSRVAYCGWGVFSVAIRHWCRGKAVCDSTHADGLQESATPRSRFQRTAPSMTPSLPRNEGFSVPVEFFSGNRTGKESIESTHPPPRPFRYHFLMTSKTTKAFHGAERACDVTGATWSRHFLFGNDLLFGSALCKQR